MERLMDVLESRVNKRSSCAGGGFWLAQAFKLLEDPYPDLAQGRSGVNSAPLTENGQARRRDNTKATLSAHEHEQPA